MNGHCDCHLKHQKQLDTIEKDLEALKMGRKDLWEAIKAKISNTWLIALIPAFLVWLSFQAVVYDTVKNIEKDVAVITAKTEIKTK